MERNTTYDVLLLAWFAIEEASSHLTTPAQRQLGQILRDRREELGKHKYTQQYVADVTGLAQTTISAWETGKVKRPHIETLSKIAVALNIDLDRLVAASASPEIAEFISELKKTQEAVGSLSGTHAEIARLLPEVPEDEAQRILSNVKWILDHLKREQVKTRGSGSGSTGGQKSQKRKGFTALQLPTANILLSSATALA